MDFIKLLLLLEKDFPREVATRFRMRRDWFLYMECGVGQQ